MTKKEKDFVVKLSYGKIEREIVSNDYLWRNGRENSPKQLCQSNRSICDAPMIRVKLVLLSMSNLRE